MNEQQEDAERRNASRGDRAEQLLKNDLLQDAFRAVVDDAWHEFRTARPEDEKALYMARLKYEAVQGVILTLSTHIETGKLAKNRLQQWTDKAKRAIRRGAK